MAFDETITIDAINHCGGTPNHAGFLKLSGDNLAKNSAGNLAKCVCMTFIPYEKQVYYLGVLEPGIYRVTYISGAVGYVPSGKWNSATSIRWRWGSFPGFTPAGWDTAAEAESANAGTYVDFVVSGCACIWYADNYCDDNRGTITYRIQKIA
jgi:hypothetical protein